MARPRVGQFEVHGLDFRPNGAWRQRTANIRAQRQAMLASGNIRSLNARMPGMSAPVVTGSFKLPVIPIYFTDAPTTPLFPIADYQDLLFSPAPATRPYSLKTFYEQLSNGNITISGTVFPWVQAPNTSAYYENGCNGIFCQDKSRFGALLVGALTAVSNGSDSLTVWAQYDNDGADGIPNSGDDDGVVDFVTFLQPEIDGACGPSSTNDHIWAHRWVIQGVNNGSAFVTKTNRAGGGKIVVNDYIMQSGQGGNTGCTTGQIMPIGTVAHETGHAFDLPDLYDTDKINPTAGIGHYGLMGAGNYARPYSPSRMEGWSLLELGWVKADTLTTTGTITLNPVATSDTVRILKTQTTGEYYILENRAAIESDTAQMNPAYSQAKSPGLYVWHIDQGRINQGSFSNTINTGAIQGVALVQADGLSDLGNGNNRGDLGDAYPGSTNNRAIDGCSFPQLQTNGGSLVSGRVDSIDISPDNAVHFRFRLENILRTSIIGSGAVEASIPGNPLACFSVVPGTMVTLKAVPFQGNRFIGWVGDTTAIDSVLVLTMNRSHSVTAFFTGPSIIAALANDLLGIPSLSAQQRLVLDQSANNNGTYDLGDFLAWVTVSGQGVPPALMARLIAAADAPRGVTP